MLIEFARDGLSGPLVYSTDMFQLDSISRRELERAGCKEVANRDQKARESGFGVDDP